MSKKKRIVVGIVVAVCIVLIGVACVYLFPYRTAKVDWNMHGYLITEDGKIKEELDFSVKGKIRDYKDKDKEDRLWLDFDFPDSFRYRVERFTDPGYFSSPIQRYIDVPYYNCHCPAYDKTLAGTDEAMLHSIFAIDPAKEYIIIDWDDESGQFLVASQNGDVTAEEIWEHFQLFCDLHA